MIYKALRTFLCSLMALLAIGASAQNKSGRWTTVPLVANDFTNVVETPEKVYFHLGGSLFSLGADNENYFYNTLNKLSDSSNITLIKYNPEGGYLFVAYASGNIDLIYDDGHTVNMAEIKDAVLSIGHGINSVAFGGGKIYVATQFGLVVYDDTKHMVEESGIYDKPVSCVGIMGDRLVIVIDHDLKSAPLNIRHNTLDRFDTHSSSLWYTAIYATPDNSLIYRHTSGTLYSMSLNPETGTIGVKATDITNPVRFGVDSAGAYAVTASDIKFIDGKGAVTSVAVPEEFKGKSAFVGNDGRDKIWFDTGHGISSVNIASSEILSEAYMPEGINVSRPGIMRWSADGSRLYVSNYTTTFYHTSYGEGDHYHDFSDISMIFPDGTAQVVDPRLALNSSPSVDFNRVQKEDKTDRITGGPTNLCVDPQDPGRILQANRVGGIFVFKDGQYEHLFCAKNTAYTKGTWTEDAYDCNFDSDGNLWVGVGYTTDPYVVLPAAKFRGDITAITRDDWTHVTGMPQTFRAERDLKSFFMTKSNMVFFTYCWDGGLMAMNNNGTPSVFTDDKYIHHFDFTDQYGSSVHYQSIRHLAEDHDGKVWLATNNGVAYIANPTDAMSPSFTIMRPVVPRNDGTNNGDFLADAESVNYIAVDPSNRKWLATENSGVYLVSADGKQIINHFTKDNSSLPSNTVWTVATDPNSNKVYFGTSGGTVVYESDSSPAAEDFSEVYAYPNPVRPDYTGWITITGLMDNSLVKIADAAGNVIFTGTSEGGMLSWNGCDASGQRVRTGVYFVFASSNAAGNSKGAVAKIMVVN